MTSFDLPNLAELLAPCPYEFALQFALSPQSTVGADPQLCHNIQGMSVLYAPTFVLRVARPVDSTSS
jgi:hypothetical protein